MPVTTQVAAAAAAQPSSPRWIHQVSLEATVVAVAWGALAFGAVYPWAYTPLAIGCSLIGFVALIAGRRGRPPLGLLTIGLLLVGLAIAIQLVSLPLTLLARISPATDAFLRERDLAYQVALQQHPLSIVPEKTVLGLLLFAALALFMIGLSRLLSVIGARGISKSLIVFGTLLAVIGIVQAGLTANVLHPLIYGFWKPTYESYPFGPFVNPNHFAGWMLLVLPLALGAFCDVLMQALEAAPSSRRGDHVGFLGSPQMGALVMLGTACLVMGLSVLMTRSRSGAVALGVGGLIVGGIAYRRQASRTVRLVVVGAVALMLIGTVSWAGLDTIVSKFTEPQGQKSFAARKIAWKDTVTIIRNFPLTGTGFDTYGSAMLVYQSDTKLPHFLEAHDDYLQLASEGGLLVGLPILFAIGVFVRDVRRRFVEAPRVGNTYWLRVGAVASLVAISAQSLVEFSLQMPGNAALFAVLAAIALHQSPRLPSASPASRSKSTHR